MKPGSGKVGEAREEVGAHPKDVCLDLGPRWKRSWVLQPKTYPMRFLDLKLHVIKRFSQCWQGEYGILLPTERLQSARCCAFRLQATKELKYLINDEQGVQSLKLNTGTGRLRAECSALHQVNPWQNWALVSSSITTLHLSSSPEFGREGGHRIWEWRWLLFQGVWLRHGATRTRSERRENQEHKGFCGGRGRRLSKTPVWGELRGTLPANACNSLLRRPFRCQADCQIISGWWNAICEAPGDGNYVGSQPSHLPSYCKEYIPRGGSREGEGWGKEFCEAKRNSNTWIILLSWHSPGPGKMQQMVPVAFHVFYSAVNFAYMLYVPEFMPAKRLLMKHFPALVLPYNEILTSSLHLNKLLCPYEARETIPGTRSLD